MKRYLIPIIIILVLTSGLWIGCGSIQTSEQTSTQTPTTEEAPTQIPETYVYIRGTIVDGGDGEPIQLINNPAATNPTYTELLAFLKKDLTDRYSYIFGPPKIAYVSSDFAEDVHNNAEAAGIRAAWVGLDIYENTEGHALDAFETTDAGLVYIDSTGEGLWSESSSNRNSWDRQAYVNVGKAYAVIDIESPKSGIEFLVGIEEYIDEVTELKEWTLRSPEILEWVRKHDVRELGRAWIEEWMREHDVELSRCGRVLEPFGNYGAQNVWGTEFHHIASGWVVRTDCMIEIPWFQPRLEVIDVDGIPVSWEVSLADYRKFEPLGIVKDIHINW